MMMDHREGHPDAAQLPQPVYDPASFRDPAGHVFTIAGEDRNIYRTVSPGYRKFFDACTQSGLHEELFRRGWLVPHRVLSTREVIKYISDEWLLLQTKRIPFISYPWEWCFSQLKEASLLTLKIQRLALQYGFTLKDSSAFNIQFNGSKPILIDSLSFEPYAEGAPWIAYRQFCQHFLAPLALMAYRSVHFSKFLQPFTDGVPLDIAAGLLPVKSFFRTSVALHIHVHSRFEKKPAKNSAKQTGRQEKGLSKKRQLNILDHLAEGIMKLAPRKRDTIWAAYENNHSYAHEAIQKKKSVIVSWMEKIKPHVMWDLGSNTGKHTEELTACCSYIVAMDSDHSCIDTLFRRQYKTNGSNLLPLVMDVTNPSMGCGWDNRERKSLEQRGPADALLALALVHHLRITGNIPFRKMAETFSKWGRWLAVEYIPKDDPMAVMLMAGRPAWPAGRSDVFYDYSWESFISCFSEYFDIAETEKLPESKRVLCLMKSRSRAD